MKLEVISNSIINKEVLLEGKKINILDFGDIEKINVISDSNKVSQMKFKRNMSTIEVLNKYNINDEEYDKICNYLEDQLESILF